MVEQIRSNGWRQGSIFPRESHAALQQYCRADLAPTDCCIVVSQSCDLLCRDVEAEPNVEVVLARKLDSAPDGNYTHTKNARRLQFHIDIKGHPAAFDAQVRYRMVVPRSLLATCRPDGDHLLRDPDLNELITWILARYSRAAFPDEFNRRISSVVAKKVKPILKDLRELTAIFVALSSWDELGAGQTYTVSLLGTLEVEDFKDSNIRSRTEAGLAKIAAALGKAGGIKVDNSEVESEAVVTLDLVRTLARWNFDYISLADPDNHKIHSA
jgi:hypothetical protein